MFLVRFGGSGRTNIQKNVWADYILKERNSALKLSLMKWFKWVDHINQMVQVCYLMEKAYHFAH
jgi:hypothetical protein